MALGIELDVDDRGPVAGCATPARRGTGSRALINGLPLLQQGVVAPGVALRRSDEANGAVAMLVIVPADERRHPGARRGEIRERLRRVGRTILQRPEERFRKRIVVTHPRTTE